MKIAILGAGAMGSLYGGLLSEKNQVYLIDIWKDHINKINENGLIIEENNEIKKYYPKGVSDIFTLGKMDLVIIFVKSINTLDVIEKNKDLFKEDTLVLSLQNGYGNLEDIQTIVKNKNIIVGTTSHGATMIGPGEVKHAGIGSTTIGGIDKDSKENVKKIKDIFLESKIKTDISDDILYLIWNKLIINIGINPLTAILKVYNGQLLDSDYTLNIMKKLVEEAIDVVKVMNINFNKQEIFETVKSVAKNTENNKSSMLQDILKNRKTEIDKINGAVVSLGKKYNISTPYNEIMVNLIKSIEKQN